MRKYSHQALGYPQVQAAELVAAETPAADDAADLATASGVGD